MPLGKILLTFLPAILLDGFGLALVYIASVVRSFNAVYCPSGNAYSQCANVGEQNHILWVSFALFIAGLVLLAASAGVVLAISASRDRRRLSEPTREPGGPPALAGR